MMRLPRILFAALLPVALGACSAALMPADNAATLEQLLSLKRALASADAAEWQTRFDQLRATESSRDTLQQRLRMAMLFSAPGRSLTEQQSAYTMLGTILADASLPEALADFVAVSRSDLQRQIDLRQQVQALQARLDSVDQQRKKTSRNASANAAEVDRLAEVVAHLAEQLAVAQRKLEALSNIEQTVTRPTTKELP